MAGIGEMLQERIFEAWQQLNLRQDVRDWPAGVPQEGDAIEFLDAAFYASFIPEEGRLHRFRAVLLCSASEKRLPRHRLNKDTPRIRFKEPPRLTAKALARCAAVHDPMNSVLIVQRIERLAIRGLALVARSGQLTGVARRPFPEALTVSINKPGNLTISRGSAVLGRFVDGSYLDATTTPLHSRSLGGILLSHVREHIGYKRHGTDYWRLYREVLSHLLSTTAARGRGGIIIWCPSAMREDVTEFLEHKHQLWSRTDIAEQISECIEADSGKASEAAIFQLRTDLIDRVECLSALCGTDGALVIDDNFRPVSAGSIIKAPEWPGSITPGPLVRGNAPRVDIKALGTRHRSAINLAGACPGISVFAISGNGFVRTAFGTEDAVQFWMDTLASNTLAD